MIRLVLGKIHQCFVDLDEFGLFDYSPLTVLKNDTAEKLRSISVTFSNRNSDAKTAYLFLDQSSKLAVSEAIAFKIEADKRLLLENEIWQSVSGKFEEVKSLIVEQKFEAAKSAYLRLDSDLAEDKAEFSANTRIQLLINYCLLVIEKGHELFGKRKFGIEILAISGLLNKKKPKGCCACFQACLRNTERAAVPT